MRAKEFVTEIVPIPQSYFSGGSEDLASGAVSKVPGLKPIPGMNPKFKFRIPNTNNRNISIYATERGYFRQVATLYLEPAAEYELPFKNAYMVSFITTHEDYQGLGLASKLYELYFRHIGKILLSGLSQTPGGQRNWVSLFNSPNLTVSGLIAIDDYFFDSEPPDPKFEKYVADIMQMGGEYMGTGGHETIMKHWYRVPMRHDKNRLEVLYKTPRVKMYSKTDPNDLRAILMATWAGK